MSFHRSWCALLLTLASVSNAVSSAAAGTIGYWRFEGDATSFLSDSSGNTRALSTVGTAPAQYTLPVSGNGSAYPDPVPANSLANDSAASTSSSGRFTRADEAAFTDTTFTAEAFINGSDFDTNSSTKSIIGQWNSTGNNRSWLFGVGNTNLLSFLYSTLGSDTVTIASSLPALVKNTDYYVAVSVNLADTSANGITFYLKDLTNGGTLQTVGATHSSTTLFNSTTALTIGSTNQPSSPFTGLIDEVRYSDTVLTADQLLVSPVPEPSTLCMLGVGVIVGLVALRRRFRR